MTNTFRIPAFNVENDYLRIDCLQNGGRMLAAVWDDPKEEHELGFNRAVAFSSEVDMLKAFVSYLGYNDLMDLKSYIHRQLGELDQPPSKESLSEAEDLGAKLKFVR